MANVVLTHPKHGAKVAISEKEVLNDIAQGWSRHIEVPIDDTEPTNNLKRKGRPRKEDTPAFLMPTGEE